MWERKGDTLLYDRINHTIYQFNQQADRDHFADSLLWSKTFQSDLLGTSQIQRASDYLIDSVLASKADSQMHYQKRYGLFSTTVTYPVAKGQGGNMVKQTTYQEESRRFSDGQHTFHSKEQTPTDDVYIEPVYWYITD